MAIKITDTANTATGLNPGPAVTAVIGGITYLFVGNLTSINVSIYRVGDDGSLTSMGAPVAGPAGISSMTVSSNAGQTYLHVTGYVDSTMATYAILGNGSLVSSENAKPLGFQPNAVTSVVVGAQTFVYAGTDTLDLIKGFGFASNGAMVELTSAAGSATALAAAAVGGTTFLFSAGRDNDTLKVFAINANGTLSATPTTVADNATLMLDGVGSLATAVVGGVTLLFAGRANDDGISVFSVGSGGVLTNVFNVTDSQSPYFKLDAVVSLTTQVINGTTYLFAAGQADDGVSVFRLAPAAVLPMWGTSPTRGRENSMAPAGLRASPSAARLICSRPANSTTASAASSCATIPAAIRTSYRPMVTSPMKVAAPALTASSRHSASACRTRPISWERLKTWRPTASKMRGAQA